MKLLKECMKLLGKGCEAFGKAMQLFKKKVHKPFEKATLLEKKTMTLLKAIKLLKRNLNLNFFEAYKA